MTFTRETEEIRKSPSRTIILSSFSNSSNTRRPWIREALNSSSQQTHKRKIVNAHIWTSKWSNPVTLQNQMFNITVRFVSTITLQVSSWSLIVVIFSVVHVTTDCGSTEPTRIKISVPPASRNLEEASLLLQNEQDQEKQSSIGEFQLHRAMDRNLHRKILSRIISRLQQEIPCKLILSIARRLFKIHYVRQTMVYKVVLWSLLEDKFWARYRKVRKFLSIHRLRTSLSPWFRTLNLPQLFTPLEENLMDPSIRIEKPATTNQVIPAD